MIVILFKNLISKLVLKLFSHAFLKKKKDDKTKKTGTAESLKGLTIGYKAFACI